ncbi:MAG: cytidylate kinase family protein [Candidatus Adiutrix sp.]
MFISIAGKLGSGKSTVCKLLSEKYQFELYSTGIIHRQIARQMDISTIELNELMRNDHKYDNLIDDEVFRISNERVGDRIVFDSRLAWHFAKSSFKISTVIDPRLAARRVIADNRGKEEVYLDEEDAVNKLSKRANIENIRFKEIYGIDNFEHNNFNLILDTTWLTPDELTDIAYNKCCEYYAGNNQAISEIILSPKSIYPTQPIPNISSPVISDYIERQMVLDFFTNEPIKIIYYNNYYYVIDGHHRLLVALNKKMPYVYAKLIDAAQLGSMRDSNKLIDSLKTVGLKTIYDFEKVGEFSYFSYPEYYK